MAEAMKAAADQMALEADKTYLDDLLQALKRLDQLLEIAVAAAQVAYGPEAAIDSFRGLHISDRDAERLLNREPGASPLWMEEGEFSESLPDLPTDGSPLAWLKQAFNLSPFDLDLLLIALAPELDLRYQRLYAYLQDDVSKKRPTVELALNLLCPTARTKLARRVHLATDAPLIAHGLLQLIPDPNQIQPPLLTHYLKPDEQIVSLLLGQEGLDPRLASCCRWVEPTVSVDELPLSAETRRILPALVIQARRMRQPLRLYFQGPPGAGKRRAAEGLANEVGRPLLVMDLAQALTVTADLEQLLKILFRQARFQDALVYVDGMDALGSEQGEIPYQRLLKALAEHAGITLLSGMRPWIPAGQDPLAVHTVPFSIPDFAQQRDCWQIHLAMAGITLGRDNLNALAGRFRLTPGQIAEAVASAENLARWRSLAQWPEKTTSEAHTQLTLDDLFTAARTQSGHDLATLAHKIEPRYTWEDIVLPEDGLVQLKEIGQRISHRHRVLGEWGFDRKLSLGKGVNALFAGPSGTGKTMAAEIIAHELGLDLYKIDLSGVVSKYIGETEKNLDRIFRAAENANAILFFDEADALFGKRSEVRDSHDRYANIEISYLLQKMEEYEGLTILATNLRQNLDEAFMRRMAFTIHFPLPNEASRRRIWEGIWPPETPLGADVDLNFLARQFKLSGGNIKNVALSAAFLAAEEGSSISMAHLVRATGREYQKLGKVLSEAEIGGVGGVKQSAAGNRR